MKLADRESSAVLGEDFRGKSANPVHAFIPRRVLMQSPRGGTWRCLNASNARALAREGSLGTAAQSEVLERSFGATQGHAFLEEATSAIAIALIGAELLLRQNNSPRLHLLAQESVAKFSEWKQIGLLLQDIRGIEQHGIKHWRREMWLCTTTQEYTDLREDVFRHPPGENAALDAARIKKLFGRAISAARGVEEWSSAIAKLLTPLQSSRTSALLDMTRASWQKLCELFSEQAVILAQRPMSPH